MYQSLFRCSKCELLYTSEADDSECPLCGAGLSGAIYVRQIGRARSPATQLRGQTGVDPARESVKWRDDLGTAGGWEVTKAAHPLELAFKLAVEQATKGKGERHGGDSVPFYDQQWTTLADHHGIGFLTGQAAKKLNEAAQKTDEEAWEREVLGALVYAGMAILKKRGYPEC